MTEPPAPALEPRARCVAHPALTPPARLQLTVAAPNVWLQYEGWYNGLTQGAIACDDAPESCAAPSSAQWYPDLFKPLGPPQGPAVRVGNTFVRHFAHATSTLDLDNPAASGVAFFA